MAFSGGLVRCICYKLTQTLTDLNDYLGPSQVCTKPVDAPVSEPAPGLASTEIAIESDGTYIEAPSHAPRARTRLETAQISLNDCLACSGCVTSAETVLIGQQSIDEVRQELNDKRGRAFVITISSQSLASLAARFLQEKRYISKGILLARIAAKLRSLGFDVVADLSLARHLAVRAHTREFFARRAAKHIDGSFKLPMLASACPGWVCYAEKAHSELLPYVAATKSPQQVAGVLAKRIYGPQTLGALQASENCARDVYHVVVMPCYDKKLEAARPDGENTDGTREVDCVLTTGELYDFLHEHGFDAEAPVPNEVDESLAVQLPEPGTSSGGYLFAILHACYADFVAQYQAFPNVDLHIIRSADYTEYVLRAPDGQKLFKGAHCYGFRNLQNVVRKLQRETGVRGTRGRGRGMVRRGRDDANEAYDYVEVMACPSGCVNGGGQMRPPDAAAPVREDTPGWHGADRRWVEVVEAAYWDGAETLKVPTAELLRAATDGELHTWLRAMDDRSIPLENALGVLQTDVFRATYRGVEPENNGLAVQW